LSTFFNDKTILIFGASGYIGSNLVARLRNFQCTIVRISRNIESLSDINSDNVINAELDFENSYFLDLIKKSDIIYYLSSQTSTYIAEKNILKDYEDSVNPILILLDKIKSYKNHPIFIFSSAVTICGLSENILVDENEQDNPVTIYDIHKLTIEKYIKFFTENHHIKGCILRLSNVYGPGVTSSNPDRGILNLMIKKALSKENLTLYGNGNFIRDYIFIDDTINAFLQASISIKKTNNKHYIIGNGKGVSIKNAFEIIKNTAYKIFDIDIGIQKVDIPSNLSVIEYRNFTANNNRFKNATNWNASTSLDDGIKKTMVFFNK